MSRKQKKMLVRIIIAAVMLIALEIYPGPGSGAAGTVSGRVLGHWI